MEIAGAAEDVSRLAHGQKMPASVVGWQNVPAVGREIGLAERSVVQVKPSPEPLHRRLQALVERIVMADLPKPAEGRRAGRGKQH